MCGCVAAVALHLVEDPEKDSKDGVLSLLVVGLAVDVEENDIRVACHGPLDVASSMGSVIFVFEELDGLCFRDVAGLWAT